MPFLLEEDRLQWEQDQANRRKQESFDTQFNLLEEFLPKQEKLERERTALTEASLKRQEQMIEAMAEERGSSKLGMGVGSAISLLGGYFVNRAYEKELDKQQRRFDSEFTPVVNPNTSVTRNFGQQIRGAMQHDPFESIPEQVLNTGMSSTTAAKSKANLSPGAEAILGQAAMQYLEGELSKAKLTADVGSAGRAVQILGAQVAKTGIDISEKDSAIKATREAWNSTYLKAEEEAANMAATIDAIGSLASAALAIWGLPTGSLPFMGGLPTPNMAQGAGIPGLPTGSLPMFP
jgi:hypothetical protein